MRVCMSGYMYTITFYTQKEKYKGQNHITTTMAQ